MDPEIIEGGLLDQFVVGHHMSRDALPSGRASDAELNSEVSQVQEGNGSVQAMALASSS
jgi:hypothetical protein